MLSIYFIMDKKYIFANIRLPIELAEDGSLHEIYNDRMIIDFELCSELPEPTSYDNQELIAKILTIHKKDTDHIIVLPIIDKEEEEEEEEGEELDSEVENNSEVEDDSEDENIQEKNKEKPNRTFRRKVGKSNPSKKYTRRRSLIY